MDFQFSWFSEGPPICEQEVPDRKQLSTDSGRFRHALICPSITAFEWRWRAGTTETLCVYCSSLDNNVGTFKNSVMVVLCI